MDIKALYKTSRVKIKNKINDIDRAAMAAWFKFLLANIFAGVIGGLIVWGVQKLYATSTHCHANISSTANDAEAKTEILQLWRAHKKTIVVILEQAAASQQGA
jgi:hypothetical protein